MTRNILRAASMAALLTGAFAFGNAAFAGECPAGKIGVNATPPGPSEPKGVTDTVLAATDLSKEMVALSDRQFRLRRLEIQPGGIVPWHSHADRPAMIYIVAGEVTEYASNCAVPILHKAGEVAPERHVTAHWWQNNGTAPVVLISADILHGQADMNM
jgi:quercetin dioxygenase-like cupin family protein